MAPSHHWIKPNESCRTPTCLAFVGVESVEKVSDDLREGVARHFSGCVAVTLRLDKGKVTRRICHSIKTTDEFWSAIYSHSADKRSVWVFAYDALHTFTYLRLFSEVEADRLWLRWKGDKGKGGAQHPGKGPRRKPGFLCIEDRPFIVELLHGAGRIKLVDVRNYLDESRERLRTEFGPISCAAGAGDGGGHNPDNCAECAALTCEAVILSLMAWWRELDGGVWGPTAAKLAWNNFRHKHMLIPICCHTNAEALSLEKGSYYGGIVEARFRGVIRGSGEGVQPQSVAQTPCVTGPIYQVDVSSMYLSVMQGGTFPRRLVYHRRCRDWRKGVADLANASKAYGCCAVVQLDTPHYPFPVRIDGHTRHACGRYWTCLSGPELNHAIGLRSIVRVAEYAVYSVGRIFRSYSDYWLAERERHRAAGRSCRERLAKLMGNSLYGRFSARKRRWTDRPDLFTEMQWGSWPTRSLCRGHQMDEKQQCPRCGRQGGEATRHPVVSFRAVAGYVQELSRDELSGGAFPAVSSWVASYGRLLLRGLLGKCPPHSILYVDTDGFLCTQAAIDVLEPAAIGGCVAAGKVRIVQKVEAGEIVGCRAYRLGDTWTHAGLPADATPDRERGWVYQAQQSSAELLKTKPDGTVKVVERKFAYDDWSRADRYDADGWLTPLTLDQADVVPF